MTLTQGFDSHEAAESGRQVDVWGSGDVLRRVIERVPGNIYVFNHTTRSNEFANRSIAEVLGYSAGEIRDLGPDLLATVIHPDHLLPLMRHFSTLGDLDDGEFRTFEYLTLAKDGREVWLQNADAVYERAADGSILRHVGVVHDIDAQKKSDQQLQALNRDLEDRVMHRTRDLADLNAELERRVAMRTAELERINRELEQLTRVATHDLKVPVNNMCSLTEMLVEAQDALTGDQRETLDWLRQVSLQTRETLESLVEVSQIKNRKLGFPEMLDLNALADRVLARLSDDIARSGAEVSVDMARAPHMRFVRDAAEEALDHLIRNAIAYAHPDRAPRIRIRSEIIEGATHLSVADNGTGLDPARDAEKVFGLFKRAHVDPPGRGIGIYCMRALMERLGGGIHLNGSCGDGAVFTLICPES